MEEMNTDQDMVALLILIRTPGISPIRFRELLGLFKTPAGIISAGHEQLLLYGLSQSTVDSIHKPDRDLVDADMAWLGKPDNFIISYPDPRYPAILRQIPDPPPALFVSGNIDVLARTQIAIVGSRNPTAGGRRIAGDFAEALAANGIVITSGLALGIDSAAHHGALQADGQTIAVLGNGIDTIYPAINREMAGKITVNGALVSEFPLFTRPLPHNFPRRNRIISGLSAGTLVIEAALKSGSLITARLAMEQGREVFAIPGSIRNPLSRGCHALIRDGAKLTESIEDIFEEISQLHHVITHSDEVSASGQGGNETLDEHCKLLLDNIGYDPVTIDLLVEETGISANLAAARLLSLELQNLIESLPGGSFIRKN
jgi:DNA processing protein